MESTGLLFLSWVWCQDLVSGLLALCKLVAFFLWFHQTRGIHCRRLRLLL